MADQTDEKQAYDPIKLLRVYLNDNPDAPGFFRNFLINRMGDQIIWYDKRSADFKKRWERYRIIIIILSASIPFLVGLINEESFSAAINFGLKLVIGLAGVIIAVLEGFNALYKSQDLYIEYRTTAEQLRQEFSYFLGQTGDYAGAGDTAYGKLVARVEAIMATQNSRWAEVARQNESAAQSDNIDAFVQEYLRKRGYKFTTEPEPSADLPPDVEPKG